MNFQAKKLILISTFTSIIFICFIPMKKWFVNLSTECTCIDFYFKSLPVSSFDSDLLTLIRREFILSPNQISNSKLEVSKSNQNTSQDSISNKDEFDIYEPSWRHLQDWVNVQERIISIFKQMKGPGFFVEIGAQDGEFLSQTLFLERNMSWTGILIEPDDRSFEQLRKSGRNAFLAPICIKASIATAGKFWQRKIPEGIPNHFEKVLKARSKLWSEILEEDFEKGYTTFVPCMSISTLMRAFHNPRTEKELRASKHSRAEKELGASKHSHTGINFLTLNIGGENDVEKIADVIIGKFLKVKVLLIYFSTNFLIYDPWPKLSNYIIDLERSEKLGKFYYRKEFCKQISDDCVEIKSFIKAKACKLFKCFGYLNVRSI